MSLHNNGNFKLYNIKFIRRLLKLYNYRYVKIFKVCSLTFNTVKNSEYSEYVIDSAILKNIMYITLSSSQNSCIDRNILIIFNTILNQVCLKMVLVQANFRQRTSINIFEFY